MQGFKSKSMKSKVLGWYILAAAILAISGLAQGTREDVVMRALRDELARTMDELEIEELERPYFVSYRVEETDGLYINATLGAATSRQQTRSRFLYVEVRVGDYKLDNTNFMVMPDFSRGIGGSFGGVSQLSIEDDYEALRRDIWLATDAAYKQALQQYAQKKAFLETKTRTEDTPDFAPAEAVQGEEIWDFGASMSTSAEQDVASLSGVFREFPEIFTSEVRLASSSTKTRFVSSEGTEFVRAVPEVSLVVMAETQSTDGYPLVRHLAHYGRSLAALPASEVLHQQASDLAQELVAQRSAETIDIYNGPVLFVGQAAAQLVAQGLAPKLSAQRRWLSAQPFMGATEEGADLRDKIGARILPRSISVVDDPAHTGENDKPLLGSYRFDDEGVPAHATSLVEKGVLKTLISGRTPVKGVEKSTGNWRGGGVTPSNLLLVTDAGVAPDNLRKTLQELVAERGAEFGVIVSRIGDASVAAEDRMGGRVLIFGSSERPGLTFQPITVAHKVYPDGREVLLRNVELAGFSVGDFKDIVEMSDETTTTIIPFSPFNPNPFAALSRIGRRGHLPLVSITTPALLFEDLTLKKPEGENPKLPLVKHPMAKSFSDDLATN